MKTDFHGTDAGGDEPLGGVKKQKDEEYISGDGEICCQVLKDKDPAGSVSHRKS